MSSSKSSLPAIIGLPQNLYLPGKSMSSRKIQVFQWFQGLPDSPRLPTTSRSSSQSTSSGKIYVFHQIQVFQSIQIFQLIYVFWKNPGLPINQCLPEGNPGLPLSPSLPEKSTSSTKSRSSSQSTSSRKIQVFQLVYVFH